MSLNTLTESLVKDFLKGENQTTQLLAFNKLDELKLTKNNVVVVYPGRFQPFHKGHYHSYSQLVSKFGQNIATNYFDNLYATYDVQGLYGAKLEKSTLQPFTLEK